MDKIKISAAQVKALRDQTSLSIAECRTALEKSKGDPESALKYLKKTGNEQALKKSNRKTSEGVVVAYVHGNKKVGALVEVLCETDFVARNKEFQDFAYDLAMHITAMNPKYLSAEKAPEKDKKEYGRLARESMALEKKSPEIAEKAVEGKIKKHFSEISLLSQPFVKNPEITIENLIKENISKMGENIQIGRFSRFEI